MRPAAHSSKRWPIVVACLFCLWQVQGLAAALQIEPVAIRLTPTERAAVMSLRNHGQNDLHVQVRTFRWEQSEGEDRLSETNALRVSPPIQQIPPGGEQIVRIVLAEDISPRSEETFRLIVDELPDEPAADGKVQLLIRYSVPVTVRPDKLAPPELQFRLRLTEGTPTLEARNTGGRSARLSQVRLTTNTGDAVDLGSGLFGYVLANRMRRWRLESAADADFGRIDGIAAHVDGQAKTYPLEVLH